MTSKKTAGIVIAAGAVFAGAIWFFSTQSPSLDVPVMATPVHSRIPYDVTVSRNKETITAGGAARHRFEVRQDGKLVDLEADEIYPHVAVISQDLSDITFYHVDRLSSPKPGIYEFDHIFSANSPYQLWFEINDNTTVDHHDERSSYIARVDIPVGKTGTPAEPRLTATDRTYQLTLEPQALLAGKPSTLRVAATHDDGMPVRLVTDVDHFYFAANPKDTFYVLDHPDLGLTQDNTVTINNITFPKAGTYALWIRVFASAPDNTPIDIIEGSFIVSVP